MSLIQSITVTLLVASLAIIAVPACRDADRSDEPVAITCPPGMMRAAKQGICLHDSCGNGVLDADEACDDGNVIAGDGCSPGCRSTESCGNGTVDHAVGEVCDDGNTVPDDRCCSDCRSCPELAVLPVDEPEVPAAVHVATEPEPCSSPAPAPEAIQVVGVQNARAATASNTPARARTVRGPTRPAAAPGHAPGRLADQARAGMVEELAQARTTIAALEQSNTELRQSLEDQLRLLDDMRRRLVHGRGGDLQ
jgi:cysteine-rich repeat protein